MRSQAHSFVRDFEPEAERTLRVDRHYLLAASRGALRLEVGGTTWSLPPARAAIIHAGVAIQVTIPQPVTTASVLFHTEFVPPPPAELAVVDLTPLARALLVEATQWEGEGEALDQYARAIFLALAAVTWKLAERPSPAQMPMGRSPEVRQALSITAERLDGDVRLGEIASAVGLAPRSLARRFEQELGMTWRAALRRLRILRAIELLAGSDQPVSRVAMDVGYSSLSAFQSGFRDLTGQTPSEYRAGFRP